MRHGKVKLYPNFDEATLPECTRQCGLVLVTHADPRGDFACSLQHMQIRIFSACEAERKRLCQAELDRRSGEPEPLHTQEQEDYSVPDFVRLNSANACVMDLSPTYP